MFHFLYLQYDCWTHYLGINCVLNVSVQKCTLVLLPGCRIIEV